jgi:hypothetical protein
LAARAAVDELYQTRVMRTVLGGDIVYESQQRDLAVPPGLSRKSNRHATGTGTEKWWSRTAGSSSDSDDSPTVSRTGIDENTSKEHEQNAFPDILMTMSQIPDVNRELAEVGAMFSVFDALRRKRER